jgi:hypothetical protein
MDLNFQPIHDNDRWAVDERGHVVGVQTHNNATFRATIVSPNPPNNSDGMPDGTIYIQTGA